MTHFNRSMILRAVALLALGAAPAFADLIIAIGGTSAVAIPIMANQTVMASGSVCVTGGWCVNPDGSLLVTPPSGGDDEPPPDDGACVPSGGYCYLTEGGYYPGGDYINHFPGGGANFDAPNAFRLSGLSGYNPENFYGIAGARTLNSSDPGAIRIGALIGTFSATPSLSDWFLVGDSYQYTAPAGGATLYLAVNNTSYALMAGSAASGSFNVNVTPEPATWATLGAALIFLFWRRCRTRQEPLSTTKRPRADDRQLLSRPANRLANSNS